jgi:hypothetical protein
MLLYVILGISVFISLFFIFDKMSESKKLQTMGNNNLIIPYNQQNQQNQQIELQQQNQQIEPQQKKLSNNVFFIDYYANTQPLTDISNKLANTEFVNKFFNNIFNKSFDD